MSKACRYQSGFPGSVYQSITRSIASWVEEPFRLKSWDSKVGAQSQTE
jgi:hypothetical protein